MTVTVDQFRTDMTAFADTARWQDDDIAMYLNIANATLDPHRWGEWLTYGVEMFTAHNIVLDQESNVIAQRGGIPGANNVGIVQSKSVGPASVSYDTSAGAEVDGGMWNLTVYGRRFLRMARMVGAGPVQIW